MVHPEAVHSPIKAAHSGAMLRIPLIVAHLFNVSLTSSSFNPSSPFFLSLSFINLLLIPINVANVNGMTAIAQAAAVAKPFQSPLVV